MVYLPSTNHDARCDGGLCRLCSTPCQLHSPCKRLSLCTANALRRLHTAARPHNPKIPISSTARGQRAPLTVFPVQTQWHSYLHYTKHLRQLVLSGKKGYCSSWTLVCCAVHAHASFYRLEEFPWTPNCRSRSQMCSLFIRTHIMEIANCVHVLGPHARGRIASSVHSTVTAD